MSGLQNKIELARKNGYSDAEIVEHLSAGAMGEKITRAREAGYEDAEIVGHLGTAPKRSMGSEIARQVGLTARYGIEGGLGLLALPGDVLGLGSSQSVSNLLTQAGLPQPEGTGERVVGDVTRAMAGQGVFSKAANMLPAGAAYVRDLFTRNLGSQVTGAAAAGGAAGATREGGGGPVAQTVAGLAGGIVAPVAVDSALTATKAIARGTRAAVDPFTQAGRERVVGTTIKRLATDPDAVIQNLDNAAEVVPGSRPTAAQASRDEGLLIAERGLGSGNQQAGARLSRRASEQNQARNLMLSSMAGDEAALEGAKAVRSTSAQPAYKAAFDDPITATPELTALGNRPAVRDAIARAKAIAAEEGIELGDPMTSVKGLHYMKLALDDTLDGAFAGGIGKTQQRAISQSREELLKITDSLSPAYKKAREQYAVQSKPVNQMETLQEIKGKVLNAGTDASSGERIMSPAKFYNAVTKNEAELAKVLTPDQMRSLKAIGQDLDTAALSASSGKSAGSNTTQNLSTAYVIGSALGGKAPQNAVLQNLVRPLGWLNKLNEQQLQDLLVDAMLEPALARSLMMKASPRAVESVGFELQQRAIAKGLGGLIGSSATVGRNQ